VGIEVSWVPIWKRTFKLIDTAGDSYYSGGKFIRAVQEVDPYFPTYSEYMEERKSDRRCCSIAHRRWRGADYFLFQYG
jgi:hypothetical protein